MRALILLALIGIVCIGCSDENELSLAEQEALKYCQCAKPIADVTYKMMAAKSNAYDAKKIGDLSRSRSALNEEMNECISDKLFLRHKNRVLSKMTGKELEAYLDERVAAVMKNCPEVAQTLNFTNR